MKLFNHKSWMIALTAGVISMVLMLPEVHADLVFDEDANTQVVPAVVQEQSVARDTLRSVMGTSERAQATVQSQTIEVQNLTKSELLRRERVRQELRNEDILQVRLEELRLQDEQRRTDQLLGVPAADQGFAQDNTIQVLTTESEAVAAPVTETPGAAAQPAAPAEPTVNVSVATGTSSEDEVTEIQVNPRGGLSTMTGGNFYNVSSRFTAGVGLGLVVSDNLTFETGFAFSEYGVSLASSNPWVMSVQNYSNYGGYGGYNSFESVVMKQNVIDAGLKMHLLTTSSRIRPFLGAGGAYSRSYINYDQRILDLMNQWGLPGYAQDYTVSSFMGYLSTGVDVKLSKSLSVGALFKYYAVLTSRESQSLNNAAIGYGYGHNPYYNNQPYAHAADADKQVVGGSLARSGFYSVLAGVTFKF